MDINWGPIGRQVYERTYSRVKADGSMETWSDTVARVVDGNLALVDKRHWRRNERQDLINLFLHFKALPAGRHLWVSGVKGRQFLFNCFSGYTLLHTRDGIFRLKDLVGKDVDVLSRGGIYRKATVKNFGKQRLFKVIFSDGSNIYATKNHRWVVTKRKGPITTDKLAGHSVPFVCATKPPKNDDYIRGLMHGFVFGDGTKSGNISTNVQMFGGATQNMSKVFSENGYTVSSPKYCNAYVGQLPGNWKELPNVENVSRSYFYGFIMGLVAADGYVDTHGSISIYQSDRDVLEYIARNAPLVGIITTDNIKLHRDKSPYDGSYKPLYTLNIRRFSLDPSCLVNTIHINNWKNAPGVKNKALGVVKVESTSMVEDVYCAVEPETETIVVGQGLLTKNCHAAGWKEKTSDHYAFTFDELMKGGGVGSNYSNRFIDQYGPVKQKVDLHIVCDSSHPDYDKITSAPKKLKDYLSTEYHHEWGGCVPIEDSREGWVDALVRLLESAYGNGPSTLVFDASRIREYGSPIRSFGGTASGPAALVYMLTLINSLLNSKIGVRLSSLDHMMVDHRIAQCVVAGNVRRSARMSIKHWKDPDIFDFITCKNDKERSQHWTTNISVEVDKAFFRAFKNGDAHAVKVYELCISCMLESGEPGFWNSSLSQHGEIEPVFSPNPCGEIILLMFENCNLGHINLGAFYDDPEGAKRAFMLMTRFLIRATFGDIYSPYQREVVDRNRRIGVGFFGFHDWLCKQGKKYSECHSDPEVISLLRQFYRVVKRTGMEYAHELRIPAPIKNTALAPTGTIAKLAGTAESGQAIYSPYFINRVRHQKDDPKIDELKEQGVEFEECENEEESVNTLIAKYACKHPLVGQVEELGLDADDLVEGQHDISLDDTLAVQAMLQREWADNSISLTANLTGDTTKKELYHTVIKYLPKLKGTTVFVGDGDRPQPPYTRITKEEYEEYEGLKLMRQGNLECSKSACPIK